MSQTVTDAPHNAGDTVVAGETAIFKTRGMDMETIENTAISFWPYRHAIIVLYNKRIISREYFIELWR